jgi:hypothetical protein
LLPCCMCISSFTVDSVSTRVYYIGISPHDPSNAPHPAPLTGDASSRIVSSFERSAS